MSRPAIKGSTFRRRLDFVEERWGASAVSLVLSKLSEEDAQTVTQALPISFYPLELNALLDETICHELAESDESIYEEMGAYSADCFAREVYSSYFEQSTATGFLQQSCDLYKRYYQDAGNRFLKVVGPGKAEIWRTECPATFVPDCLANIGFTRRGLQLAGCREAACREVVCAARQPSDHCLVVVTWRP